MQRRWSWIEPWCGEIGVPSPSNPLCKEIWGQDLEKSHRITCRRFPYSTSILLIWLPRIPYSTSILFITQASSYHFHLSDQSGQVWCSLRSLSTWTMMSVGWCRQLPQKQQKFFFNINTIISINKNNNNNNIADDDEYWVVGDWTTASSTMGWWSHEDRARNSWHPAYHTHACIG